MQSGLGEGKSKKAGAQFRRGWGGGVYLIINLCAMALDFSLLLRSNFYKLMLECCECNIIYSVKPN